MGEACQKHFGDSCGCLPVVAEDVLKRLSRAKDTGRDPRLIILDIRETRFYQHGHILTALSMSCHTRTMAKRAIVTWDMHYGTQQGCPAPAIDELPEFCTQISQVACTSILVYNQRGECPFCDETSSCTYLIDALIARGNRVYFLLGGFDSFQLLRSSEFIDRGPPADGSVVAQSMCDSMPDLSRHFLAPIVRSRISLTTNLPKYCDVNNCEPYKPMKSLVQPLSSAFTHRSGSEILLNRKEPPLTGFKGHTTSSRKAQNVLSKGDNSLDDPDDVLNASVSQILPYLYIGNARDAQNLELLSRLGITHIINVTNSVPMPFTDCAKFHYLHLPATDSNGQNLRPAFESAVRFINEARKSKGIVLVHCQAGVSRSVAIVMAFIMDMWRNFNVFHALEFVQTRRPVAGPNLHFMGQLQSYHDDLHNNSLVN